MAKTENKPEGSLEEQVSKEPEKTSGAVVHYRNTITGQKGTLPAEEFDRLKGERLLGNVQEVERK
jgi:hypothetical protein